MSRIYSNGNRSRAIEISIAFKETETTDKTCAFYMPIDTVVISKKTPVLESLISSNTLLISIRHRLIDSYYIQMSTIRLKKGRLISRSINKLLKRITRLRFKSGNLDIGILRDISPLMILMHLFDKLRRCYLMDTC